MKIADAGYFIGNGNDRIKFWSNDYFLDHGMLRIRLSVLKRELEEAANFDPRLQIDTRQIAIMKYWLDRKKNELREFYCLKGDIVIIADIRPMLIYRTDKSYEDYHKIDLLQLFTLGEFGFNYQPSEGVTFTPDSSIRELTSKAQSKYYFTIETDGNIKVLATTVKTLRPISFLSKIEKGRLLMLHHVSYDIHDIHDFDRWLFSEIVQIFSLANENLEEIALSSPDWIKDIKLEGQQRIAKELSVLREQKKQLEIQIETQDKFALNYEILKSILFTSGKFLEKGIDITLQHLDIHHIIPPGSETDLIIHENDQYIAVEIKGVTGSASLKNSRQLEDWVNKTALQYDVEEVKGLLLINCYHHLPLVERTGILFPPNVIEFSKARRHCLLTTRGLLNMVRDFDAGKLSKAQILDLILETAGVLNYD